MKLTTMPNLCVKMSYPVHGIARIFYKKIKKLLVLEAVLSFLIKKRVCLIHPLPAAEKREVRELEKCALKLANSGCSFFFNGACLRENVLLNFIKI